MNGSFNLLIIEDSEDDVELILESLHSAGINPTSKKVDTLEEVSHEVQTGDWDAILCDYSMPKLTAPIALETLKNSGRDIPFIVVSGSIGETTAVELMKMGAHDYIIKDRLTRLKPAIERAIEEAGYRARRRAADEEQRQWAEDLARSNEDLQRFAYVASHDLSEPLRMIALHVQLLEQRLGTAFDAEARKSMEYVIEGSRRMKSLIEDLLSYSRLEMTIGSTQNVKCENIVKQVLANLEMAIVSSNARITIGALPTISADPIQVLQVFQNLLSNALKFHDPNVAPFIEIEATTYPNQGWVFSVKDNGIGIDSKYFARIFNVFQRLYPREKFSGNGIGLSICKKTIGRMGGEIWVESEEGKGSTFYFTIPEVLDKKFLRTESHRQK